MNVGGIGTLFFGASIISIIEIVYYFVVYPWNPRQVITRIDRSNLRLPAKDKNEVLAYIDFKERMMNAKYQKPLYPFTK